MKITPIIYTVFFLLLLASCAQKEEFEGLRPDARLAEELARYEEQLAGATHGWIGYLYPAGGGGYTFKFDFDGQNRVQMYAGHRADYATTARESSYRLRAAQVPSLYFDTYSYLHELADPDPARSGGPAGQGQRSDFEFSILSASADTLHLKGNLNESELILVRATAAQGDDYMQRVYAQRTNLDQITGFPYYHNRLVVGGQEYNITINTDKSTVSFYSDASSVQTHTITYVTTENGMLFQEPFEDGAVRIDALQEVGVDLAAHLVTAHLSDGTTISIQNEAAPIAVDADAPRRMYNEVYQYFSPTGFTVNGVADGFGLSSISGYIGMTYAPRRYADGYDAFFIYWNNGANYVGPALNTQLTTDGKLVFYNIVGFGNNGTTGLTQQDVDLINVWVGVLVQPQGYYVYRTSERAFDLVSVSDARVWARFQ